MSAATKGPIAPKIPQLLQDLKLARVNNLKKNPALSSVLVSATGDFLRSALGFPFGVNRPLASGWFSLVRPLENLAAACFAIDLWGHYHNVIDGRRDCSLGDLEYVLSETIIEAQRIAVRPPRTSMVVSWLGIYLNKEDDNDFLAREILAAALATAVVGDRDINASRAVHGLPPIGGGQS